MNAAAHPTDQALRSYGLGKIDGQAAEVISRHLDVCPDCVQRIAGMSSDSFSGDFARHVVRFCHRRRDSRAGNPIDGRGRTAPSPEATSGRAGR